MTENRGTGRIAGLCFLLGVVLYILPTALHGDPPIDDAEAAIEYVADRNLWTIAHFANIGAVILWLVGVALVTSMTRAESPLGRATRAVWSVAAAAFAVYFSLHALGLQTASDQFFESGADTAAVVERTEALLLVLGSTAFVAQGLVGTAIAMFGLALLRRSSAHRVFAGAAIAIGAGWAIGAIAINFDIIVPCTALAWLWFAFLGGYLVAGRLPFRATIDADETAVQQ